MGYGIRRAGAAIVALTVAVPAAAQAPTAQTASGTVQGAVSEDGKVLVFTGIPYAKPPVGDLRWQPPQPADSWTGVRKAMAFGNRCTQGGGFDDMIFRDAQASEDCLYLNVWAPARAARRKLPVMVWIHGGGFQGGGSSEPRQDGAALARKGVIVVSMNYRLGVFGFFSHPELTREHGASGNYGLLDQAAALQWVRDNIAAFGGDPANVTLFGESAGSISVSAHMASPVSKGLFARAIGQSGGIAEWVRRMAPVSETGKNGVALAEAAGAADLAALRAKSTAEVVQAMRGRAGLRFWPNIDGYFFTEDPVAVFAAGKQARVPLMAGWTADEHRSDQYLPRGTELTRESYEAQVNADYGEFAPEMLKLFPATTPAELERSAHDLASAEFITFGTWKWMELHRQTSGAPLYRYRFDQPIPQEPGKRYRGTHHASDITFTFQALSARKLAWDADHHRMSDIMSSYWTNFARTGDPNGAGLPQWPRYEARSGDAVMHLRVGPSFLPQARPAAERAQYELLERVWNKRRAAK